MSNTSKYYAWAIALAAVGGAILLGRRKSSLPSLMDGETIYYSDADMKQNPKLPLGYRNNNPLNIDYYNSKGQKANNWKGLVGVGEDGRFCLFQDLVYGYRAALVLLRGTGYIGKGLDTIRKIITKFAPENENNTAGYIARVSQQTGIDPDEPIARNDKDKLTRIVYAMSIVENGTIGPKPWQENIKEVYNLPNMDIINEAWRIL